MVHFTQVEALDSWDGLDGIDNICAVQVLSNTYRMSEEMSARVAALDLENHLDLAKVEAAFLSEVDSDHLYILVKKGNKSSRYYLQTVAF
jgi:hypothetical protein|tara:strand:- start:584 stop:853 length:270 start_codon:yes stop_codon:yes gene_type:complete